MARREPLRAVLGTNLRKCRKARGWTQEFLGGEADIHRTMIGAIERAEISTGIDQVDKLAWALGIDAWKLLMRAK
jgi:transcriptional regulator with XRE-family HTH domain